ncbi:TIM-barrel domain-containing protein [Spiroplasma poulsonii]|nr:TIM-barrel domain-containing protein [Spiroplasma poulsonii]
MLDNAIKYAKLKRKLLPYFKMCELEAATTGVPILRAMVLENEDDSIAQLIYDQFYLGSNLLVAPVLTPQTTKREVYLPAGEWFLFGQKEKKYLGKQSYLLVCPVDEMLIFVKGNNIIPTIKEDNYHFEQLDTVSLKLNLYGTLPAQYDLKFKLNEKLIIITYQNKKFDVSSNHNYLVK